MGKSYNVPVVFSKYVLQSGTRETFICAFEDKPGEVENVASKYGLAPEEFLQAIEEAHRESLVRRDPATASEQAMAVYHTGEAQRKLLVDFYQAGLDSLIFT